jgi:hypothetical protein
MKTVAVVLSILLALTATATETAAPSIWKDWEDASHRICPSRHVPWVGDGGYLGLLDAFESTLPNRTRDLIRQRADHPHRCASERAGFSCEMAASLDAYKTLRLLNRFVSFGCGHVRCEEYSLCSQFPRTPRT